MYITQALSYGNAWARLTEEYPDHLGDIKQAVALLTPEHVANAKPIRPISTSDSPLSQSYRLDGCWFDVMSHLNWGPPPKNVIPTSSGRKLTIRHLGHVRGNVSLALIRHRELLSRWLYTVAPMASRVGVVDIPIALVLTEDAQVALLHRPSPLNANIFEVTRDELVALSPLSHASPFLILAASAQSSDIHVVDLSREEGVAFRQIVVNRSIEFPPQYHQAGLGVLTYFGTILREKYPNHDAKVRIEQDGLTVRLVIESENGDREIIEKALQEYELVVLGERPPEALLPTATAVIDLKNELRIAQVRIESQRDIISLQGEQIVSLRQLIGHSLSRPSPQIALNVQPIITVTASASQCVEVTTSIPEVSDDLRELLSAIADDGLRTRLLDLAEALDVAASRTTPEAVRASSGISKLRSFIEDAAKTGTKAHEVLKGVENGIGILQGIGKKYNAIAEWCGAPQVPRALLGEDA